MVILEFMRKLADKQSGKEYWCNNSSNTLRIIIKKAISQKVILVLIALKKLP